MKGAELWTLRAKRKADGHEADLKMLEQLGRKPASSKPGKMFEYSGIGAWIPRHRALLRSAVWRHLTIYQRRILEALEVKHAEHAGLENGYLTLTYDEAVDLGVPRRAYRQTIAGLVDLKLVEITHHGKYSIGGPPDPNLYRVTYLKHTLHNVSGSPSYFYPTHDWIKVERDLIAGRRAPRTKKHDSELMAKGEAKLPRHPPSVVEAGDRGGDDSDVQDRAAIGSAKFK